LTELTRDGNAIVGPRQGRFLGGEGGAPPRGEEVSKVYYIILSRKGKSLERGRRGKGGK